MYQPCMQNDIRSSIGRRLNGLMRAVDLGLTIEQLQTMKTQVATIYDHINSLEAEFSRDNWEKLVEQARLPAKSMAILQKQLLLKHQLVLKRQLLLKHQLVLKLADYEISLKELFRKNVCRSKDTRRLSYNH